MTKFLTDSKKMRKVFQAVERKSHSLLELTQSLKAQIEKTYTSAYWIKAEINRLNYYPQSGHCYPELVEKKNGKIVAEIRGFLFRNLYEEIDQHFVERTGKKLGDGLEVLLLCRVSFDPKYGLSLNISNIDPSYTIGEMARLREEAIRRLKAESLLDGNKTKVLPYPTKHLAVISVETSKGWRDFHQTLASSKNGPLVHHELFPAKLQGDVAVTSIQSALKKIESRASQFDAVAIIRGGGGETGMDCYDNFYLAKAVATFPIPVLTGIGHSTNLTVTERCSNQNLITPTALAQFLIDQFDQFEARLSTAFSSLSTILRQSLPWHESKVKQLGLKLKLASDYKLNEANRRMKTHGRTIRDLSTLSIDREQQNINRRMMLQLDRAVGRKVQESVKYVEGCANLLKDKAVHRLNKVEQQIHLLEEKTKLLDPAHVLKRGYSMTKINGKSIDSIAKVEEGDTIQTIMADGEIISLVKQKKHG